MPRTHTNFRTPQESYNQIYTELYVLGREGVETRQRVTGKVPVTSCLVHGVHACMVKWEERPNWRFKTRGGLEYDPEHLPHIWAICDGVCGGMFSWGTPRYLTTGHVVV